MLRGAEHLMHTCDDSAMVDDFATSWNFLNEVM